MPKLLPALLFAIALAGCRGAQKPTAKGVQGDVYQPVTDNSRVDLRTNASLQLAKTMYNVSPDVIKGYLEGQGAEENSSRFNPAKVMMLFNGQVLQPGLAHQNVVHLQANPKVEYPIAVGVINYNAGPSSTMRDVLIEMMVPRAEFGLATMQHDGKQTHRVNSSFLSHAPIHPTDPADDDPPIWQIGAALLVPEPGIYDGKLSIQSTDKAQIIRRFKLHVSRPN